MYTQHTQHEEQEVTHSKYKMIVIKPLRLFALHVIVYYSHMTWLKDN